MSRCASTTPDEARPDHRGATAGRPISALAFDLDGTIYLGARLLPGARELIEALGASDVPFVFATNNSSKTGEAYLEHLRALGLPAERQRLVTSNDVAIDHLLSEGFRRPFLVATKEVEGEYRSRGLSQTEEDPDCVLLTFDTTLTYDKLRRASRHLLAGVPYLATHPDLVCPMPTGPVPDCGAFIALLEAATGRRPIILGKPHAAMAATIAARLARPPSEICFVGDRLYTDVRMANESGFVSAVTLTGETTRADLAGAPHDPDIVVGTLVDLHAYLLARGTLGGRSGSAGGGGSESMS